MIYYLQIWELIIASMQIVDRNDVCYMEYGLERLQKIFL